MRGGLDFGVGRVGASVADVLARRGGEEHRVLRYETDPTAHRARVGARHVDAVDQHATARRIVEAQQQLERRALAGARWSDEGDRFAGRHARSKSSSAADSGRDG